MKELTLKKNTKPAYANSNDFLLFKDFRNKVNGIVERSPKRKNIMLLKVILFPLLYVLAYATALVFGNNIAVLYGSYFFMGILIVLNFLNLIHDAVHGTIFRSKTANKICVYFFDLLGANSYVWKIRHVRFHHNYPNVNGWDTDIEQSPLARIYPTGSFSKFHKYQHIYLPFLYPFYLPNCLVVRDFKDFFKKNNIIHKLIQIPRIEYIKLFFFKLFFLFYMLFIPKVILSITWPQTILAFVIFLFTASIFSLIVLLSPHANVENVFPEPDAKNRLPFGWMMHILQTTNDVNHDSFFTRFFMGSFNFHVAHHLFPNVSHVYYPEITRELTNFAKANKLPYRSYPLSTSLKNHYMLLKKNRMEENIFEEAM
jgi:linoleoyl-CoA desaturase